MPDVLASNGYVHAINRVLFPPPAFVKTLAPMPEGALGDTSSMAAAAGSNRSSGAGGSSSGGEGSGDAEKPASSG
jgi:hypothetical protein